MNDGDSLFEVSAGTEFSGLLHALTATHHSLQAQAARSVDTTLVMRNWSFGWYIVEFERGAVSRTELYGKKLIAALAQALTAQLGQGFSRRNLELFRQFYLGYGEIAQTASAQSSKAPKRVLPKGFGLSAPGAVQTLQLLVPQLVNRFTLGWSHYVVLLTITNPAERSFYEIEAQANSWGIRELKRQLASSLYERLALSRDPDQIKALAHEGQVVARPADVLKSPFVLEFLDLPAHPGYSEHELETAIIDRLEHFLLELGKGFLFEARQKRFTFDDDHFYVDLVFYNRLLKCYVLIDLKRDKLTHQDLGQMQMYVNYFDRHVKLGDEAPTIGIVLCHSKNDALVELTLPANANIYASQYQLYLPSKDELLAQIEAVVQEVAIQEVSIQDAAVQP
jgi:predicted nuclease of restriction endonuclease-like (RecB) superfamily